MDYLGTLIAKLLQLVPGHVYRHVAESNIYKKLKKIKRKNIHHSMYKVMLKLIEREVPLHTFKVLEMFGGFGENTALIYANFISSLEIWEINKECRESLRRNFPLSTIKITDSYREMSHSTNKYDLIVVDNTLYHPSLKEHVEHFDIFPGVFTIMNNTAILILNIVPVIDSMILKQYPWWLDDTHSLRRKVFYKTENPRDITPNYINVYKDIIDSNGFELDWFFLQSRESFYSNYLVLKMRRREMDQEFNPNHLKALA